MRRAGPFYSLLVAGKEQTRLPLAASLEPNHEDVVRSRAWLPIAGLVVGSALAVVAALLFETALVPTVIAALVIALGVFATGGWFEIGVARAASSALRNDSAEASAVTVSVTMVVLVLVKAAALLGTDPTAWTGAIVASHVVGRWALLVAIKLPKVRILDPLMRRKLPDAGTELGAPALAPGEPTWIAFGIASGVAALGTILAGGAAGAVAFAIALAAGWIGGRIAARSGDSPELGTLAATGALVELATLLLFAAWVPASL